MKPGGLRVVLISQGLNPIAKSMLYSGLLVGVIESVAPPRPGSRIASNARQAASEVLARLGVRLSLREATQRLSIPYFRLDSHSSHSLAEWVHQARPDLILVYSMSQLLNPATIRIPRLGTLNLHPSILPAWRGPNPWPWIYLSDSRFSGYSLHFIDPGEDTGDIVRQETFVIERGAPLQELRAKSLSEFGMPLVQWAIEELLQGRELPRSVQPASSPTPRAARLTPAAAAAMVDWSEWPAERIWHCLRGMPEVVRHFTRGETRKRLEVTDFVEREPRLTTGRVNQPVLVTHRHGMRLEFDHGYISLRPSPRMRRIRQLRRSRL